MDEKPDSRLEEIEAALAVYERAVWDEAVRARDRHRPYIHRGAAVESVTLTTRSNPTQSVASGTYRALKEQAERGLVKKVSTEWYQLLRRP